MTVSSSLNRQSYIADGVLTIFAYPFKIFFNTDLQVYVDGVLKTLTTHYTVSGVGDDTGGNVTFVAPPANLAVVLILRVEPFTQATDLPLNDKFPSTTVEDALDKLTMLAQQLNEVDGRALKLAVTSLFSNISVPDPSVGKYLRWLNATALENADLTGSGLIGIPVTVLQGGTGLTAVGSEGTFLQSVAGALAYSPDGRVRLTNKNGAGVAAADVMVIDSTNDSAAVATTVVGNMNQVVVVDESISNNATGYFSKARIVTVNVQGNVTRGNFLRTSATTKRAEDAGSSLVDGAFAQALTAYGGGAAGTVTALLFGVTLKIPAAAAISLGRGFIDGLVMTNAAGDVVNDIDIAIGAARSSDDTTDMVLASAITKRLDAAWAVGSGNGGLDTGAEASSTWYHVHLIKRPDTGVVDALFSVSATAPTLPTNYTKSRRIGSFFNDSGSSIMLFFQRPGGHFAIATPTLDIDTAASGTAKTSRVVKTPLGVRVIAMLQAASIQAYFFRDPSVTDQAPSDTVAPLETLRTQGAAYPVMGQVEVWTDTTSQISTRNAASETLRIVTLGWWDPRGVDA